MLEWVSMQSKGSWSMWWILMSSNEILMGDFGLGHAAL